VNGVSNTTSFLNPPIAPPSEFEIGSAGNAEPLYFTGSINDVRAYNRPLSASEVQELYQFEATDVPTPQAIAVADVINGFVVAVTVTYQGYGYTSEPTVTLSGGGGSGARAEAVVSNGMVIAIAMLDAGSGYTNPPTVVVESPVDFHPFPATATADVTNGFVVGATITYGGDGYTNTPAVKIIGGGGSGAQAVAVVSNGHVVEINFLDAGYGYTNPPVVVIEPPFIQQPTLGIGKASLLSFTQLAVGANYQFQVFSNSIWADLGAAFAATNSIFTQYVGATVNPAVYRMAATPVPLQAFATAQVVDGFVIGATVTSGGTGYTSIPAVTINGSSGSNATAVAAVSGGSVTAITIIDAGNNYTNATITISPPPATALSPSVSQAWQLNMGSLSPYDNYQLEFTSDLSASWSKFGPPFTTTSATNAYYFDLDGARGFFRLMYLP
jgi:hypothetical protein